MGRVTEPGAIRLQDGARTKGALAVLRVGGVARSARTALGGVLVTTWLRLALGLVLPLLLLGACFDFDATMSGGPPGGDAGDTNAPDAGPYCANAMRPTTAGALFFCADFDEGALPGAWNVFNEVGGALTESDASFVSPPDSLDETTHADDGGQPVNVALRTPFPLPPVPSTISFGFDLEPVAIDPTAGASIVLEAIDFLDGAGDRYSVELSILVQSGASTLVLGEQSGAADGGMGYVPHQVPPTMTLPTGSFTRVEVALAWSAATSLRATVSLGGAQALDVPLSMTVRPSSLQIGVGTSYVSTPSPGWHLRYDNVLFTAM